MSANSIQPAPASKRWWKIGGAIVALVVLVVVIVPFFVNADTFRPTVESEISSALGRKVTLGHLSFSLLSGSLVADQVAIADDPSFSTTPFFQAKSLHIGVSTGALIFGRRLHITRFSADAPEVHLISGQHGTWNYSSLGHGGSHASAPSSANPDLTIGELKITNGTVEVSSQGVATPPATYKDVNLTVHDLSFTTAMPFDISATLPGNGAVKLNGTAGPIAQPNAVDTPLRASLSVRHFDPVACGAVAPSDGVSMLADIDGQVVSNGKTVSATGKIHATQLKLSPHGTPASQPVDVDFNVSQDLGAQSGHVSDIALHTGSLAAHVNGTYQLTPSGATLNLHLSAPGLPVDGIEALLPAAGIHLPSGSSLHGGTLTANLAITGPAAAPQIAGPVEIDNTQLAGFALASKIEGLTAPGKSSNTGGTQIHVVRANVVSTREATQLNQIYGDIPGLGTASGNGTVSPASGAMDFKLVAKLSSSGPVGSLVSQVGGIAGTLLHTATSNGIPLAITGTTSHPSIRVDMGSMLGRQGGTQSGKSSGKAGGILGLANGLLHKPK